MQIIYTMQALKPAPIRVELVIDTEKTPKAIPIPQYGAVTLKTRQNSCLADSAALSRSKLANASEHEASVKPNMSMDKGKANLVVRDFIKITVRSISKHLSLRVLYFQIILLIGFGTNSFANTEFRFTPRAKIEAQISSDELNRIEVNGGDIMEVVGDEAKYSLYWSSDWRNLFIKPKVPAGETFELSLIFFGGLAQDIRFTAGDTTAKTITINMSNELLQYPPRSNFRPVPDHRLQLEVAIMMRAMFEEVKGKYCVTDTKRLLKYTPNLQLTQIKAYRYKDLSGAVVEVKNLSKSSVNLREEDFRGLFKGTLAINLKSLSITPKQKTTLFIVTKGGSSDR